MYKIASGLFFLLKKNSKFVRPLILGDLCYGLTNMGTMVSISTRSHNLFFDDLSLRLLSTICIHVEAYYLTKTFVEMLQASLI